MDAKQNQPEPLQIDQLIPVETEITLKRCDVPLKLRPCTLADDVWSLRKFSKPIEFVLKEPNIEEIVAVFFHLLTYESQCEFKKTKVKAIDEKGNACEVDVGGPDLVLQILNGPSELIKISKAIMESVGFSRPILEAAENEAIKKNSILRKVIPINNLPDGSKSLTSSATNTDGPPTTS